MSFTFRPAKRENVPLLIGLAGGTGSGKTLSALKLARGLAGDKPFAVIDTENGRALHYADDFAFHHGELHAPFRPERYADAIEAADKEGYPVIVVDSASHEHAGDGGLLDWHEEEFQRLGGRDAVKMTAWIKPKMSHRKMVSRLLQVRAHVLLCFRAYERVDIIDDPDKPGKKKVVAKQSLTGLNGWIPESEKSLPYELTLSFLLTADRPGFPKPIKLQEQHRPFVPLDAPLGEDTGRALAAWAAGGALAEGAGLRESSAGTEAPAEGNDAETAPSANAQTLARRLMELATQLGVADKTADAIAKHAADEPWLERAIVRAQNKLAQGPEQSAFRMPEAARRD